MIPFNAARDIKIEPLPRNRRQRRQFKRLTRLLIVEAQRKFDESILLAVAPAPGINCADCGCKCIVFAGSEVYYRCRVFQVDRCKSDPCISAVYRRIWIREHTR